MVLLLFLMLFSRVIYACESEVSELSCLDISPEIRRLILTDIVNNSHVENAGETLRSLRLVKKTWKDTVDDETAKLIKQRSTMYRTPRMVTAAYIGTKTAIDYYKKAVDKASEKKLTRMFKHALFLYSHESLQSRRLVINLSKDKKLFPDKEQEYCVQLQVSQSKTVHAHLVPDPFFDGPEPYRLISEEVEGNNFNKFCVIMKGAEIKMFQHRDTLMFFTKNNDGYEIVKL